MGVMLQMHTCEHWKAEPQQQGRAMAHEGVPEAAGVSSVVAGVVNHGALQVEGQKAAGQEQRQRPAPQEPAGDRDRRQHIPPKEQAHSGIPGAGRIEILPRHGAHRSAEFGGLFQRSSRLNRSLRHPQGSGTAQWLTTLGSWAIRTAGWRPRELSRTGKPRHEA